MSKIFIFFFAFLLHHSVCCQDHLDKIIRGKIVDKNGESVDYVNIYLLSDPSVGTYSNSNGSFEIKVNVSSKDTLLFSRVGFERLKIFIDEKPDSILVKLNTAIYNLPETTIYADTALEIVKRSIARLTDNLADKKNILQGFFREVIRSSSTYDRLIEAAVDVFDKGNNAKSKLEFRIRELRKSDNHIDLDWKATIFDYLYPKNGLHGTDEDALFNHNYVRDYTKVFTPFNGAFLNQKFFDFAAFNIEKVTHSQGDSVLCIGISPNDPTSDLLPAGEIYIRIRDYAILEMNYSLHLHDSARKRFGDFLVPGENYLFKTIIKFKEYNHKMYLGLLYRKSFRVQGKVGKLYDEKLFVTNEIITELDKAKAFRKKTQQNQNIDLYSESWKYDEQFWSNYNVVIENPLTPDIKADLERDSSLDSQFRKNE